MSENRHEKQQTMDQFELEKPSERPLIKRNFLWMIIAGVMIVAGFLLMLGESSTTERFNPDCSGPDPVILRLCDYGGCADTQAKCVTSRQGYRRGG